MGIGTDRDLSCYADMAIAVSSVGGDVLSCSLQYAFRLNRSLDEVVGRNVWEWNVLPDPSGLQRDVARVVEGATVSRAVTSHRTDGRIAMSQFMMRLTHLTDGQPAIIGVHRAIFVPSRAVGPISGLDGADMSALMGELASELGTMAARGGLSRLSESLEVLVGSLGETAAASG